MTGYREIVIGIYTFGLSEINLPRYATQYAACFDLSYQPGESEFVGGYNENNTKISRTIHSKTKEFTIFPGDRLLVPTSMIFDLPQGFDMRIHPRSGMSISLGLSLINCEGVIDSDYVGEILLPIVNYSSVTQRILPNTRMAQGEIPKLGQVDFQRIFQAPGLKGDRTGGFGSTGVTVTKG